MARPARKVSKSEINTCFKVFTNKIDKKQAMTKIAVSDEHTFKSIYFNATLHPVFQDMVAKMFTVTK